MLLSRGTFSPGVPCFFYSVRYSDFGCHQNIEISFSRKVSPAHGSRDAGGTKARVKPLQEDTSGCLNGKLIKQNDKMAPNQCQQSSSYSSLFRVGIGWMPWKSSEHVKKFLKRERGFSCRCQPSCCMHFVPPPPHTFVLIHICSHMRSWVLSVFSTSSCFMMPIPYRAARRWLSSLQGGGKPWFCFGGAC